MKIKRFCIFDPTVVTELDLEITAKQYASWKSGIPIQQAMPHLSADEREFIMTGIPPGDWEKYVGPKPTD